VRESGPTIDDQAQGVAVKSRKVGAVHGIGAPIKMKHGQQNSNLPVLPMKRQLCWRKKRRRLNY